MKVKKIFVCSNCGVILLKWIGKCLYCGEWNIYIEEVIFRDIVIELKDKSWWI